MDRIIPAFCFVLIGIVIYATYQESVEWQKFSKEHDCVVIAKSKGAIMPAATSNGSLGMIQEPDKVTYKCNDGITYTR